MLDQKDLQALAEVMEQKLQPIRDDIQEIKTRMTKVEVTQENDISKRMDLLLESQQESGQRLQRVEDDTSKRLDLLFESQQESGQRLQRVEDHIQEVKTRVTKVEVTQENDISKRLDLLLESQQETGQKLHKLNRLEATLAKVKSDTEVIKSVVTEHSKSIRELKAVK